MNAIRWILFAVFTLCSIWVMTLNWIVFYQRYILQKTNAPSWTPLFAGILGVVSIFLFPFDMRMWWWVPLVIDWGSLPGLAFTCCWYIWKAVKKT